MPGDSENMFLHCADVLASYEREALLLMLNHLHCAAGVMAAGTNRHLCFQARMSDESHPAPHPRLQDIK